MIGPVVLSDRITSKKGFKISITSVVVNTEGKENRKVSHVKPINQKRDAKWDLSIQHNDLKRKMRGWEMWMEESGLRSLRNASPKISFRSRTVWLGFKLLS